MSKEIYVVIEHLRGEVADISYVMLAAARVLAGGTGGEVVALLAGHDAKGLAADLAADRVLYVDHGELADFNPEAYVQVIAALVGEGAPRAVLFGETSIGADVAGRLSARLGLPLVSRCHGVRAGDGAPGFVSQICGGRIMAEGDLPGPTVLVTMVPGGFKPDDARRGRGDAPPAVEHVAAPPLEGLRTRLKGYIEPDTGDVDISAEPVLVSIGRGVQNRDDIELVEELVDALGGVLCASRPVVDQGWLPTTRLVGRSGRSVKPKLYLALGLSGAPEHVEAITGSEVIIAVNIDPAAPIFDLARYGAELDMFDLLPALTEKVQEAKEA